jgi:hypothetical protein
MNASARPGITVRQPAEPSAPGRRPTAMMDIRTLVRPGRRRVVYLCAALAGVAAGLAIGLAARVPGPVPADAQWAPVPQGTSSGAVAAWVRADGKILAVGCCAGTFSMSASAVTVQVGQQIDVQMLQEEAIPGSMRVLVPAYPLPRSTDSWVLVRTLASSAQATAIYTAMHPGRATLMTKAYCLSSGTPRPKPRDCPVIDVTVISGPQMPTVRFPGGLSSRERLPGKGPRQPSSRASTLLTGCFPYL